jgi:diguanylate cyclase (GGDEF)-like protein
MVVKPGLRGRGLPLFTLVVAILLAPASLGFAYAQHVRARTQLNEHLQNVAREEQAALANYFERARSIVLLTAQNPAFPEFYEAPGSRQEKILQGGQAVLRTNAALDYLQQLYPTSIGESCFIDVSGAENSRVVRGVYAAPDELSPDESSNPFFSPTFALREGEVHQAAPYVSPDTGEWVISNSTPMPSAGRQGLAIVHYEVTVESFRREAAALSEDTDVVVLEAGTGQVVLDSSLPQDKGEALGRGRDPSYLSVLQASERTGLEEVDGVTAAYRWLPAQPGNVNRWVVVAKPSDPQSLLATIGVGPLGMLLAALLLLAVGVVNFRNAQRELTAAAITDGLTGLGNRRKLMADLRQAVEDADEHRPVMLALYDLDGFKTYNDTFGHPAGDALLQRLGGKFATMVGERGAAYRLGGDEFCLLSAHTGGVGEALVEAAAMALSERGEGFVVTSSKGWCVLPVDARDASEALRVADTRMYDDKLSRRPSPDRQSRDVLLRALHERYPELRDHLEVVGELAERVAAHVGLSGQDLHAVRRAGELHDIGKVAVPDSILRKPGDLDDEEWAFMRRHALIGERILDAAPSLTQVAQLVRSHHERWDGAGYPSGIGGEDIPLGARIVAVCDAYHAMTSGSRPYREPKPHAMAIGELRRCAGTQFDPSVVEAFCEVATEPFVTQPVVTERGSLVHGHE